MGEHSTRIKKQISWLRGPDRFASFALQQQIRHGRVQWGDCSYGVPRVLTFKHDTTRLKMGRYCSIAEGVTFILGGNHPVDRVANFPTKIRLNLDGQGNDGYPSSRGDITVGNDVWIGYGATILSGVSIGDGAVVAAKSVVTRDVPSFALVAGSPAKVQSYRFEKSTRDALASIRWWDWPSDHVARATAILSSAPDAQSLLELEQLAQATKSEGLRD